VHLEACEAAHALLGTPRSRRCECAPISSVKDKIVLASRRRTRNAGGGLIVRARGFQLCTGGNGLGSRNRAASPSRAACTRRLVPHVARAGGCRRPLATAARRYAIWNPVGYFAHSVEEGWTSDGVTGNSVHCGSYG
jgi:hypothetical protein